MTVYSETECDALTPCVCGEQPVFADVSCLAFIVKCKACGRKTEIERSAVDAYEAWESLL